jgi:hypothetical protein
MTYNIFIENLRDKRLLERPRRRWESIKMDLKKNYTRVYPKVSGLSR